MPLMEVYKQNSLEKAFNFTSHDLAENRQGRLTETQIGQLRRDAGRLAMIVLGVLGGLGILTLLTTQADPAELPLFLFCLLLPALITLAFTVFATEAAVVPRVVAKRSGVIHLAYGMLNYTPALDNPQKGGFRRFTVGRLGAYKMVVGEEQFQLSRDQWQQLRAGAYANIYFLPTLHKIVAVEMLDTDIETPQPPAIDVTTPLPEISSGNYGDDSGDIIRA
jgi:hypothetical protein